ncbi:MAG: preprotein translocase subunit SecE, partial [Lachnospiraceae bacterium]|nr:preprotein translocase subunit SecE [Candidatus Minthocola equi]
MGEKFKNLKSEFKKVIWPDKKRVLRQSLAVVACSIVLGLIIA